MKCQTVIFVFCICGFGASDVRVRRHLVFNKGSRLFFSINVRDNLFEYSNFFAHVFGVKMDWDLPYEVIEDTRTGRIQRRDVHQALEKYLNQYKYNGSSCVYKFVCEASFVLPKKQHFLSQFYEIIFTNNQEDGTNYTKELCEEIMKKCPLSLSPLTSSA